MQCGWSCLPSTFGVDRQDRGGKAAFLAIRTFEAGTGPGLDHFPICCRETEAHVLNEASADLTSAASKKKKIITPFRNNFFDFPLKMKHSRKERRVLTEERSRKHEV